MAKSEIATLGGGCFWCLEAVYLEMEGVEKVESGYMGGITPDPTYKEVCSGNTGHVEIVQVTFAPDVTSFAEILSVFFTIHDPTTKDRQGNDVGTQYRSVIFYHSDEQKRIAEDVIRELDKAAVWPNPVVTALEPVSRFYRAEDYHQDYFRNNSNQPYCAFVVASKVKKFREKFASKMRSA